MMNEYSWFEFFSKLYLHKYFQCCFILQLVVICGYFYVFMSLYCFVGPHTDFRSILILFSEFAWTFTTCIPGSISIGTCSVGRLSILLSVGIYIWQKSLSFAIFVSCKFDAEAFDWFRNCRQPICSSTAKGSTVRQEVICFYVNFCLQTWFLVYWVVPK